MDGKLYFVATLITMGLLIGGISGRFFSASLVYARYGEAAEASRGQKWEYCALTKAAYVGSSRGGLYWISYFRDAGVEVVEVEDAALERNGPARAIAKLGAEGWELVGEGPLEIRAGGVRALYFKRPKL